MTRFADRLDTQDAFLPHNQTLCPEWVQSRARYHRESLCPVGTFACLRITDAIFDTVARLATGSGGLTLGRAGFAPAG
jgi:hypothetical protein